MRLSRKLTPHALTSRTTSPAPGTGSARSSITMASGPPGSLLKIALIASSSIETCGPRSSSGAAAYPNLTGGTYPGKKCGQRVLVATGHCSELRKIKAERPSGAILLRKTAVTIRMQRDARWTFSASINTTYASYSFAFGAFIARSLENSRRRGNGVHRRLLRYGARWL